MRAPHVLALFGALVFFLGSPVDGISAAWPSGDEDPGAGNGVGLRAAAVQPSIGARLQAGGPGERPREQASTPNQGLIAFLRSPVGVALGVAGVVAAGLAWTAGTVWALRERLDQHVSSRQRKKDRRAAVASTQPPTSSLEVRLLAGILSAGCLLLPLVFAIAFEDVFALPKTVLLWVLASVVLALLVAAAVRGRAPVRRSVEDAALLAFLGLVALSTVLGVDLDHAIVGERLQYQGLISLTTYVVLFVGARLALAEVRQVRLLSLALLTSAVVVAVYALAQWFGFDQIWSELFKDRVFSTVGQANALAATLATATVMTLALVSGAGRARSTGLSLFIAVALAGLVVTFSRGGYVALALGLCAAGIVLAPGVAPAWLRKQGPRLAAIAAAVVVAVGALTIAWQPARDLAARVIARTASIADASESSNRAHLDLWAVGVRISLDHPLLGTGPDSYVLEFRRYRDEVLPADRAAVLARFRPESPHNVYIAMAVGSGLPALTAFLVLIGSALVTAARAARLGLPASTRLALAGLVGAVCLNLVTFGFVTAEPATSAVFWILLGSLAGTGRRLVSGPVGTTQHEAPAR